MNAEKEAEIKEAIEYLVDAAREAVEATVTFVCIENRASDQIHTVLPTVIGEMRNLISPLIVKVFYDKKEESEFNHRVHTFLNTVRLTAMTEASKAIIQSPLH